MKPEIEYTEAAKERLADVTAAYTEELENAVVRMKGVPGEDVIEITAADIERAASGLHLSDSYSNTVLRSVTFSMALVGLLLISVGAFWGEFSALLDTLTRLETPRLIILGMGLAILSGSIMSLFMRWRRREALRHFRLRTHQQALGSKLYFRDQIELGDYLDITVEPSDVTWEGEGEAGNGGVT